MAPTRGVLVVTADPALRREAELAYPSDFDVVVVSDAREAWRELQAWTPAALVVDLLSGSAGGYALGSDMSQDPRLRNVPVLMLLDRHQDEWLAGQAGAAATRTKPVEAFDLVASTLELMGEKTK
ncbi:MAG: two-component system response regulator [Actinomycetota bacterium]